MKFFLILIAILLSGCVNQDSQVIINDNVISVEIADTKEERDQGLMFRESLCEDCGMLFIFDFEARVGFWMKNTLIPLDMIFISKDLDVIDIISAEPCKEDPCDTYSPKGTVKYVLEVNKGYSAKKGIKVGDKIKNI